MPGGASLTTAPVLNSPWPLGYLEERRSRDSTAKERCCTTTQCDPRPGTSSALTGSEELQSPEAACPRSRPPCGSSPARVRDSIMQPKMMTFRQPILRASRYLLLLAVRMRNASRRKMTARPNLAPVPARRPYDLLKRRLVSSRGVMSPG